MSEFKVGDKIRQTEKGRIVVDAVLHWKDCGWQSIFGEPVDDCFYVVSVSSKDNIQYNSDKSATDGPIWDQASGEWEIVIDQPTTNPFLKTVTETRIVSGYHELPNGLELYVEPRNGEVKIDLESGIWDKQSLTELTLILAEISEAMA